jgi:hypothetical protein
MLEDKLVNILGALKMIDTNCFFFRVTIYWNKIHTDYIRGIPRQCLCTIAIVPTVSVFTQQTILWGYPGATAGQLPEARRWR